MENSNRLSRNIAKLDKFPKSWRKWMRNRSIGKFVPFIGTAGLDFVKMSQEEVIIAVDNRKKVQNHIHQVHAAATVLLAESASGMVVGMNIPDDKLPLMKSLSVKYIKRSQGRQTATAVLSEAQIEQIQEVEKGEVNVEVKVVDETNEAVVVCEMIWAWIPKKKR